MKRKVFSNENVFFYFVIITTEYTQSGNGCFLAYIPSWWKIFPIFTIMYRCSVRSSWEGRYTQGSGYTYPISSFHLYPFVLSVIITVCMFVYVGWYARLKAAIGSQFERLDQSKREKKSSTPTWIFFSPRFCADPCLLSPSSCTVGKSRQIGREEEIFNTYLDIFQPALLRRSLLAESKLMHCW